MARPGSSCWPPTRRAKNTARSFGGICKAQNSLRTSGTMMYQKSLALNRQSSYLQQALLLNDGKRKQRELIGEQRVYMMTLPCFFFGGRNLNSSKVLFLGEFMMEVLNVVAIIVAGLMVGCELAIAAFVHPTLDKLPDNVHLPASGSLPRVLVSFIPFCYF